MESVYDVWDTMRPVTVQGSGSLKTWSFTSADRAQVILRTEGRPLDADVEVWAGPDNVPQKLRVYSEDGWRYPFTAAVGTPRGYTSTVAVRNVGQMEFPIEACVEDDNPTNGLWALTGMGMPPQWRTRTVQGGSVFTFPCDVYDGRVQVFLETDGRPMEARIELLEGPNSVKQVIDLWGEDGESRPFLTVMETPGPGSTIRIVNTGPLEFPLYASVEPIGYDGRGGYRSDRYRQWGRESSWDRDPYGSRRGRYHRGRGYGYDDRSNRYRNNRYGNRYNSGFRGASSDWSDRYRGWGNQGRGNWYDQSAYRYY